MQVSDEHGNIVWSQPEKIYSSGNYQLPIPVNNLQHGLYQVNALSKGKIIGNGQVLVEH
jgi:hypothetical protein